MDPLEDYGQELMGDAPPLDMDKMEKNNNSQAQITEMIKEEYL